MAVSPLKAKKATFDQSLARRQFQPAFGPFHLGNLSRPACVELLKVTHAQEVAENVERMVKSDEPLL